MRAPRRLRTGLRVAQAVLLGLWSTQRMAIADGVLRVHPGNPRYFTDDSGRAIYLTGAHTWANLQDGWLHGRNQDPPPPFDFAAYLDAVAGRHQNHIRLWMNELPKVDFTAEGGGVYHPSPTPWSRTGPGTANDGKPRFDLATFDQSHFDRLRARVVAARERGVYVTVMLFEGYSVRRKNGALGWNFSPFHANNNINGINGDPNGNGYGSESHSLQIPAITALHHAYLRKVVDTVNDLDNVLYEVANEEGNLLGGTTTRDWQYAMMDYLRSYEAGKAKQHPVVLSCIYNADNNSANNTWLTGSTAEAIAPWGPASSSSPLTTSPAATTGAKVVFADSDHVYGVGGGADWVWRCFLRGYNVIYMDDWGEGFGDASYDPAGANGAMGATRRHAERMNLAAMTPQNGLASSGFCLAAAGVEYLVYAPTAENVTLYNLPAGTYTYEWSSTDSDVVHSSGEIAVDTGNRVFATPVAMAALHLKAVVANQVATPTVSPTGGDFAGSVEVTLACATPDSTIRYTLDGTEPGGDSTLYAGPVTLTASATLRAKAFAAGRIDSNTRAASFRRQTGAGVIVDDDFADGNLGTNVGGTGSGWNAGSFNGAPMPTESGGCFRASMGTENGIGAVQGKDIFSFWDQDGMTVTWVIDDITVMTPHAFNSYLAYCWELGIVSANNSNAGNAWNMSQPNKKGGFYVSVGKKDNSSNVELWVYVSNKLHDGTHESTHYVRLPTQQGSVLGRRWTATFPLTVTVRLTSQGWSVDAAGMPAPIDGNWSSSLTGGTTDASITDEFAEGAFLFLGGRNHGIDGSGNTFTPNSGRTDRIAAVRNAGTVAATPVFDPLPGNYAAEQAVAIRSATPDASLRYTLDGSVPSSTSGTLYTGPVTISASATLKAIAYTPSLAASAVAEGTYSIGAVELLANTGFETDLTGWSANGGSIARTISAAHGGAAACRSQNRSAHWAGPRQSVKAAVLAGGPGDYAVSAWLQLASGSDTGRVELGVKVAGQWTWSTVVGEIPAGAWGRVSGVVPLAWSGTVDDVWFAVSTGTSTVDLFVDDCQLSRHLSGPPPDDPPGTVANGGFEDGLAGWMVAASDGGLPACAVLGTQGQAEGSSALALGNANATGNAVLSQTVATEAGTLHALHFDYGAFGAANRRQRMAVEVLDGGTVLADAEVTALGPGNYLPQNATFAGRMLLFEAASGTATVRFTDRTTLADSNSCDGMLDRVRLETPGTALAAQRRAYLERAFGMFLHYNMGTYTEQEWASPNQPLGTFAPTALDTDQWADVAQAAGMRYGILTAKHHDGFALWDTAQSAYDITGTGWYADQASGQGDIVKRFVDSFRSRGLRVGLYYSVWDRSNGIDGATLTSRQATDYVKAELSELLGRYGTIDVLWTDGWGWKDWHGYVRFDEVYAHVKALSPDTLVVDNNHTAVNTDLRTYEQSPFPAIGNVYPSEVCATLRADGKWFWGAAAALEPPGFVVEARETCCARRAAFLLGMPPDQRGLIPDAQVAALSQARTDWLQGLVIAGFQRDVTTGRVRLQLQGRPYETYRARGSASPRFDGEAWSLAMQPAQATGIAGTVGADGLSAMAGATGALDVSVELGEAAARFFRFEALNP